jgi:uncharacterized membrane protein affecting hemolysin expression
MKQSKQKLIERVNLRQDLEKSAILLICIAMLFLTMAGIFYASYD